MFNEGEVGRRMYHAGFKIDDSIFFVGGQGNNGKIFNEFMEINITSRKPYNAKVHRGRELIGKIF